MVLLVHLGLSPLLMTLEGNYHLAPETRSPVERPCQDPHRHLAHVWDVSCGWVDVSMKRCDVLVVVRLLVVESRHIGH